MAFRDGEKRVREAHPCGESRPTDITGRMDTVCLCVAVLDLFYYCVCRLFCNKYFRRKPTYPLIDGLYFCRQAEPCRCTSTVGCPDARYPLFADGVGATLIATVLFIILTRSALYILTQDSSRFPFFWDSWGIRFLPICIENMRETNGPA